MHVIYSIIVKTYNIAPVTIRTLLSIAMAGNMGKVHVTQIAIPVHVKVHTLLGRLLDVGSHSDLRPPQTP